MDTIIAYRTNDGPVQFVLDDQGDTAIFSHRDEAIRYAEGNRLFHSGQAVYQIIELDEL